MAAVTADALISVFDKAPLNRRYWTTFALLSLGACLDFFDFFIVGYLVAQLGPQWHLTYGQSSVMLLAAGVGAIVSALFWGALSDAFGRKRQIAFGYLICAIGAGSIALVPDGAWQLFALSRVAVGFGFAAANVPALAMIIEITPTRVRTVVSSLWVASHSVGILSAPVLGATLYTVLGWRDVAALGVMPAAVALLVLFFVPESVRWLVAKGQFAQARRLVAKQRALPLEAVPLPTVMPVNPPRASLAELWSKPRFVWLVLLTMGGAATVDFAIVLWGPTIISLLLKTTIREAARYFVLVVLGGMVGKVFFSILPCYVGRRRAVQLHGFGLAAGIALAGYFHSVFVGSFPLFVLLLIGTNVFMQGGFTNLAPYNIEVFGVRLGARAAGLSQAANGVGKILGPLLLALSAGAGSALTPHVTEHAILPAFLVLSICALVIGLAVTLLGPETHGKPLILEDDERIEPISAPALPSV